MLVLDGTTDAAANASGQARAAVMGFVLYSPRQLGIMPISVSALVGLGLMIATGCLSWRDAA